MPSLPEPVAYLWHWFERLCGFRHIDGMGNINRIFPETMRAWFNNHLVSAHAWEYNTLEQLDIAVINVWKTQQTTTKGSKIENEEGLIPVSDVKGVKALFRGMKSRLEMQRGAQEVEE